MGAFNRGERLCASRRSLWSLLTNKLDNAIIVTVEGVYVNYTENRLDSLRHEYELQLAMYNEAPDADAQDVIYYRMQAIKSMMDAEYLAAKASGGDYAGVAQHDRKSAWQTICTAIKLGRLNDALREVGKRVLRS
jgi:hypothetical protein